MASKYERESISICSCYHAGFTLTEISEYMGKRVSEARLETALGWEQGQIVIASEIKSLYRALLETRQLKKRANAVLELQFNSVTLKTRRFAIKEVSDLITRELEYEQQIRDLSRSLVTDAGHDDIASLPDWIGELERNGDAD